MTTPRPSRTIRGLFMGSGGGLAEPGMAERLIELSGQSAADVEVLYLGTATYDLSEPKERQAGRFEQLGCTVRSLEVATRTPTGDEIQAALKRADVVLVSGGNTLYAVDRWVRLGIDELLREAVAREVVLCGGSAGAICWFDGGHSDSMDPTSYLEPLAEDDPRASDWRYIRVDGIGLLPGLLCPHFDRTQSNGVLRADDFEAMLLRHPGEIGLGLDNWAGLLVDGEAYEVVAPDGADGSALDGGFVRDASGTPGLWIKEVREGRVLTRLAPTEGRLSDILRGARHIELDPLVEAGRAENAADGVRVMG
jgi:dipeptidase E